MCPHDPVSVPGPAVLRSPALSAFEPELAAIPEDAVLTPRLDVPSSVTTVLGAAPEIEVHRAAIAAKFGDAGVRLLDRLVPTARALMSAHGEHLATIEVDLEPIAKSLGETRERLKKDVTVAVQRKALDPSVLEKLIGGQGYHELYTDVTALTHLFRVHWGDVSPHTKVTLADIDAAEAEADRFSLALGRRKQATARATEAGRMRARAFTLFFRTYDGVRRIMTFLRWYQGDVDQIAPSLYAGRTRSQGDDVVPVPSASTNTIAPGMPGAPAFDTTPNR